MINIHIYPSPITHENRIEREIHALSEIGFKVFVFGTDGDGLPEVEKINEKIEILRLTKRDDKNILRRILFMLHFYYCAMKKMQEIQPANGLCS